jgi:amidophosphoribosyltransferase
VGADSLGYISQDGLIAATDQPRSRLCTACFSGEYPIPLPDEAMVGKHLLEDVTGASCGDGGSGGPVVFEHGRSNGTGMPLGTPGYGAEDALSRP